MAYLGLMTDQPSRKARDKEIRRLHSLWQKRREHGSISALARKFGITRARVFQIVAEKGKP